MEHNILNTMRKEYFLHVIFTGIKNHPEWTDEDYKAIQGAILEKISDEVSKRADTETAVVLLLDKFKNVAEHQKEIVARTVVNSKMFGGTEYAKQIEKRYLTKVDN